MPGIPQFSPATHGPLYWIVVNALAFAFFGDYPATCAIPLPAQPVEARPSRWSMQLLLERLATSLPVACL